MNVLLVSPLAQYKYVNLCYRYVELGEVAGYLRDQGHTVSLLDGLVMERKEWLKSYKEHLQQADVLVLHHSGESVSETLVVSRIAKSLRPRIKSVTYGVISTFSAEPFRKSSLDAIVVSGDWEVILADWLQSLGKCSNNAPPRGVLIREGSKWVGEQGARRVPAQQWSLPALDLLPLEKYKLRYGEMKSIAGFRERFELSFSVSRGCPYSCWFCPAGKVDGHSERRRPVWQAVEFLRYAVAEFGFDYFAPFSACFTLDRDWVVAFCRELMNNGPQIPWRCVVTLQDLDWSLMQLMAVAGCQRIGIGVETLNPSLQDQMGKKIDFDKLAEVVEQSQTLDITPLCFLIDGLPGQKIQESQRDAEVLRAMGATVRISKLIDYRAIPESLTSRSASLLSRDVEFL